ncbi:MAG: hypothetical protein A2286_02635 [Gammaproteobacteria bacterium RIFOXYA12_FULL_61_12]|nr:MAG: hypothetical protein A2514_00335 [Gammaproteobacteria bacterium RIFOXYD12_FULL_61_37]OGT93166.1 MAG: hypothetical protein A2286_02635 [Gammaproteobacteria bacterium RIFOXYA12_FULL_61_12]
MKRLLMTFVLTTGLTTTWAAGSDLMMAAYQAQAGAPFDAVEGKALWGRAGQEGRQCADCHGQDPKAVGKHATTGKRIEPMAPSVNPERLTDPKKVEKWFKRNCEGTWGRECSAQEKGHLLAWLSQQ